MPTGDTGTPGNLPYELSSFVGRRRELRELKGVLAASRLVTLTGVGGVGKTRLALGVGATARRAFRDGVWFVDLTQIPDLGPTAQEVHSPDVLAYVLMTTLGVRQDAGSPMRQLTDYLARRQALLVLDNCEQLLPVCAILVDALLSACPGLRVLATSRERLTIRGEVLYPVAPLPAPEPGLRSSDADLARYDSVALFLDRVRAAVPDFALTEGSAAAVAELCRRLDGLPLAIELAAAWVRTLEPQQILDRLEDRFALLAHGSPGAPARQQALRACVEWSFNLCSKPERLLWARSSVFVGGFELDALEGICADESLPAGELLDVLAGLIDKSVVDRARFPDGATGQARYRMLETIRDHGRGQLIEVGEHVALRGRHCDWYQRLAAQAMGERISRRQTYWIARFSREHPNVRAAVEFCLTEPDHADGALRIVTGLPWLYWSSRGVCSEGLGWLERALTRTSAPTALRVRAVLLAAFLASCVGDADRTTGRLGEGEDLARRLHDGAGLALAAFVRGAAGERLGGDDPSRTIKPAERGLAILSALPEPERQRELTLRLQLLLQLGHAVTLIGDHDRARRCFQEVLDTAEARGAVVNRVWALWGLALVAWRQEHKSADHQVRECLRGVRELGALDPHLAAMCVEALAWIAAGERRFRRAATLLGAADRAQTDLGKPIIDRVLIADRDRCERRARVALGDAEFTEAFRQGRALPLDGAVACALDEQQDIPPPASGRAAALTRRERQVADLIAQGLTNKEIAARLMVAQRTAEGHVEHILAKLGFTNRTQVAAWRTDQLPPKASG